MTYRFVNVLMTNKTLPVVCQLPVDVVGVHMCERTNRKKEDGKRFTGSELNMASASSWLGAPPCEGQKQPTVEAKLLPAVAALMLILKRFHKEPFSGRLAGTSAAL